MVTRSEIRDELRQVVATMKHHVEQLELFAMRGQSGSVDEPSETVSVRQEAQDTADTSSDDAPIPVPEPTEQASLAIGERVNPFAEFTFEQLRVEASTCIRCPLSKTRTNVVFGAGNPEADLMFVGEAPGHDEDLQGLPFVGRSGQLLTKIIEAMGLTRDDVYICNVLKCRPPENRNPLPLEVEQCHPYLLRQVELIQPKIIVGLGTFAVHVLLRTEERISRLRGKLHTLGNIQVMPTYHPSFLLRNPNYKRDVWDDMKVVMAELARLREGSSED